MGSSPARPVSACRSRTPRSQPFAAKGLARQPSSQLDPSKRVPFAVVHIEVVSVFDFVRGVLVRHDQLGESLSAGAVLDRAELVRACHTKPVGAISFGVIRDRVLHPQLPAFVMSQTSAPSTNTWPTC